MSVIQFADEIVVDSSLTPAQESIYQVQRYLLHDKRHGFIVLCGQATIESHQIFDHLLWSKRRALQCSGYFAARTS